MIGLYHSLSLAFVFMTAAMTADAFSVTNNNMKRLATELFLKDSIADMIDAELNRLQHKQDIEEQLKAKLEKTKQELQILPENYEYNEDFEDSSDLIIKRKDKKMAKDDPQRYCADRCVSTGHCDVFEDLYSMSAMEVRAFCTDCVLSEEEEACDVPESMFENLSP